MIPKPTDFTTQTLFHHLLLPYMDEKNLEFSVALNRGLKWELIAIEHDEEIKRAGVRHPEGGIFTAKGHQTEDEFLHGFEDGIIISFDLEAKLNLRTRCIVERDVSSAGMLAQCAFPSLPWNKETYIWLVKSFMDDLEKLSKHYGLWLENNIIKNDDHDGTYGLYITGNGEYRIRLEPGES